MRDTHDTCRREGDAADVAARLLARLDALRQTGGGELRLAPGHYRLTRSLDLSGLRACARCRAGHGGPKRDPDRPVASWPPSSPRASRACPTMSTRRSTSTTRPCPRPRATPPALSHLTRRGFGLPSEHGHSRPRSAQGSYHIAQWPRRDAEPLRIRGYGETIESEWGRRVGRFEGGFFYEDERPRAWLAEQPLWAVGLWAYDYALSYEAVETLEAERGFVRMRPPYGRYYYSEGQTFHFLNVFEELTEPGSYVLDPEQDRLYVHLLEADYAQRDAEGAVTLELDALTEPLIRANGAEAIEVEGLVLEHSCGRGIDFVDVASARIADCRLRELGGRAIAIEGGRDNRVLDCQIESIADGAIHLRGGDRRRLIAAGHEVARCHIRHIGVWSRTYHLPIYMAGIGMHVHHNLIHDCVHAGILFLGNDMRVEANEIYRIALETGDVGAIYHGADPTYRGNVIRGNIIHNLGGIGLGAHAIYNDDAVCGAAVLRNWIYQTSSGVFLAGGRQQRVEENIFADVDEAILLDSRASDANPHWSLIYENWRRKLHGAEEQPGESGFAEGQGIDTAADARWCQRYPDLAEIIAMYEIGAPYSGEAELRRNLFFTPYQRLGRHASPLPIHYSWSGRRASGTSPTTWRRIPTPCRTGTGACYSRWRRVAR